MTTAATSTPPRFAVGDAVKIDAKSAVGHCRTPWYVRGKSGIVVEIHGSFRDPVRLAYHRPGLPAQVLYKIRMRQTDLWFNYAGQASDHLDVDIYESWLKPARLAKRSAKARVADGAGVV